MSTALTNEAIDYTLQIARSLAAAHEKGIAHRDLKPIITCVVVDPKTKRDLWVLTLSGDRQPFPFLQTEFNEAAGLFSPDGRWTAYCSDESGGYEIYVQSFPSGGGKKQVSTKGRIGSYWRRVGKELYYYSLDGKLMVVTNAPYTVTADGQRFLLNTLVDE